MDAAPGGEAGGWEEGGGGDGGCTPVNYRDEDASLTTRSII